MTTKKNGNGNGNGTIDVWSAFCESMGTRCTFTANGVRCENGVTTGTRCHAHPNTWAAEWVWPVGSRVGVPTREGLALGTIEKENPTTVWIKFDTFDGGKLRKISKSLLQRVDGAQ